MRRLLQRKLCRRKTLLFTLFLLSLIIGTTPASAKEVTDVLTNAGLINKTTKDDYTSFSGKSFTSDAVYAGKIAGTNGTIQLNKTKSNNIVTTASGGTLKKIKVFWNSKTSKNSLQVYAQNSHYAASTTLPNTGLGTLAYSAATTGSDGKKYTEYTFPEGSTYTYVAIAGGGGATYSDSIEITWEDGTTSDPRQDVTLSWSESAVSANIGETFTAPTLTVNPADATYSLVYSSSNTSVAEIATNGTVTIKAVGQTTITAAIPDDKETYKPKSASYTLTVIDPNEVYYLVKTKDDFDVTQECILVAYNNKDSYQAAMGKQIKTNKNAYYREAVPYSPIATSLPDQLNAPDGTVPFTLEPVPNDSTYYIKVGEGKYISVNTGKSTDTKEVAKSDEITVNLTINETDHKASLKASSGTRALGYNYNNGSPRFASYTATDATYNKVYLYQKRSATPALGDITFDPAPGANLPINSKVTISCKNATQISYSITKNEGPSTTVVVPGSVAEVTITENCTIQAQGTNDEGDSDIAYANYTVQKPFTLYTDFYEETGAPYIPDGNYVLVGSVSSGESAGEYYMAEQKDDYRVANKIQPLEDGRLPIDNKYQINIKKEENGNYSLIVAEGKYLYAEYSTTTSDSGTTANYSVKEGDAAAGQGKWKANIKNGKVYFSWTEPSYGDFKFNPQSPRFKTYKPDSNSMVSFSLYSTNIPLCRDLKFDTEEGSTVVRGSSVTISCINAAKIFYAVGDLGYVTVEGNKASVIISDDCSVIAYAENAAGVETKDAILAYYTVTDPYVEFAGYEDDGSIPDGKYLFVGKTGTNGDLRYMAEQATSDNITYRKAVLVTPFVDGRIGVSDKHAITVKKEEGANYSLITADSKYLYANSSTSTTGEGESQVTTTNYSVVEGDKTAGEGKWKASVDINNGTVEFVWNDDASTLRYYANGEKSRFKTYVGSIGTKFYLYAPTPKPAQVVCTDATITNDEIQIAVNKTITFKSEGAGKMACKVLDIDSSVETFDIVDRDTYTFTAASEPTEQIITIIPYDQYGAAYEPFELVVDVYTHDVPTISYNLLEDVNKVKFIATNGEISEIRPYRIDGTLADAVSYANNTADIAFSNPRYKVSAKNTFGDTVEESFSFIQELCERNNNMEGVESPYSAYLVYKNATGTTYERNEAVFELDKAVDSFTYSMEGVLLKGNDLKNDYPFLLEDYTISLHVSWLHADSPTFLQAKDNTGSEVPARAKALDDIDAAVGIYDFVESGGAPLYFNSEGKNAINGSVVFVPFEYAQLKIDNIQDVVTAIGEILDEDDTEEVFYNLQGVRVENPDKGIYIRVKGNKTEKILK